MTLLRLAAIALVSLAMLSCSGGGRNYWLYPAPHLAETEEAVFLAYESHQLIGIDGDQVDTMCWGRRREAQGYQVRSTPCRLHLQPGEHSVTFYTRLNSLEQGSLNFTAVAGKVYGLDRSLCTSSAAGGLQNCRVRVVEVGSTAGGG